MPRDSRSIRVFVSSTFRDMVAERDRLAKFTFPALHRLCEERGVRFTDVDLRWGITDEQAAEGGVLPICLEEIENCRPYFIGILGERYGWLPQDVPEQMAHEKPWLLEHRGKSVTELEILHGVLRAPEMAGRCFFYFRDPAYAQKVPPEVRADYVSESEASRAKLTALKDRIRASGLPLCEDYADPEALARRVEDDLRRVIDEQFPLAEVPDPLERERQAQRVYADSRRHVYVADNTSFDRLDAHVRASGLPLVVSGEPGSGKSALLANWAELARTKGLQIPIVEHYADASESSGDWASLCRRVTAELARAAGVEIEAPEGGRAEEQQAFFMEVLSTVAARGPLVLLIDGVDQLEDRSGALDLAWLPVAPPPALRIVLSTRPGRPLEESRRRGWDELTVRPLGIEQRSQLVGDYLRGYRKTLSPWRMARIVEAPHAGNPLFLRILLDELRLWGSNEQLDSAIERYLDVQTLDDLFERVLARWEGDYEQPRPGLVRDTMTAIWASRRGLDETELLAILGEPGRPLPRGHFSPLHLAAASSLVSRSGRIGFAHDLLRIGVRDRYLATDAERREAHRVLARHFERGDRVGQRAVEELPWQLQQAGDNEALAELLADVAFVRAVHRSNRFDVLRFWATLESAGISPVTVYAPMLQAPASHEVADVEAVARLLRSLGHPVESERLRAHVVDRLRASGDPGALQKAINKLALVRKSLGDPDGAFDLLGQAEEICRREDIPVGLQAALNNRALILMRRGRLDEALAMLKETEDICRRLGRFESLESSIFNQAAILRRRGDIDGAMKLFDEAERLSRNAASPVRLKNVLAAKVVLLRLRGDIDAALAFCAEIERICRELGSRSGVTAVLQSQAMLRVDREEFEAADVLLTQAEGISAAIGTPITLQSVIGCRTRFLRERGDTEAVPGLLVQREAYCRKGSLPVALVDTLTEIAALLAGQGDLAVATVKLEEASVLADELQQPVSTLRVHAARAALLSAGGDAAGAREALRAQERICRSLGARRLLGICLENLARLPADCLPRDEARAAAAEALEIARMIGAPRAARAREELLASL